MPTQTFRSRIAVRTRPRRTLPQIMVKAYDIGSEDLRRNILWYPYESQLPMVGDRIRLGGETHEVITRAWMRPQYLILGVRQFDPEERGNEKT